MILINNIYTNKILKIINNFEKYKIYIITFIFIIIFLYILYSFTKKNNNNNNELFENNNELLENNNELFENNTIMDMKRPFLNILDNKGRKTNIVFITHPFSRKDCEENYKKAKKQNIYFLGMSSYCDFPAIISNPHDSMNDPKHLAWKYNYFDICKGWCHCFRDPSKYGIPYDYPRILLSESDFAKYKKHIPNPNIKKEYDFLYVCLKDNDKCDPGWQSYNRNWELAEKCLKIMCDKYHLKGLLIGRINCKIPNNCHSLMKQTDFLEYDKFINIFNKCRFVFVPNKLDASPRVMTEAICYNLPVLCNYHITGGWKYITDKTGEFFNRDASNTGNDFEKSLSTFLQNFDKYTPRDEYIKNHKEENEGRRLLNFCIQTIGKDKFNFKCTEDGGDVGYLIPSI
jgi:hypothetical protein